MKHNTTTTQLEPLPRDPSTNKSYVLIKDSRDIDRLWKPDIFIDEAIKTRLVSPIVRVKLNYILIMIFSRTPSFDDMPQSVKVYEDSRIRWSKRLNFDIGCHMEFGDFPVDQQICEVKLESYSYQASVCQPIVVFWRGFGYFCPGIALWLEEQAGRER